MTSPPTPTAPASITLLERASRYLNKMPRSVSKNSGHDAAIRAAVVLMKDFALSEVEALPLLEQWNILCEPMWSTAELTHKLRQASAPHARDAACPPGRFQNAVSPRLRGIHRMTSASAAAAPPPSPPPTPVKTYCPEVLDSFASRCETEITPELLREISFRHLPPETDREATALSFLESVFSPGDKVILFDVFESQGSHLYVVGEGCFRLSANPGDPPTPSKLPLVGGQGVWFLANPVDGEWRVNDSKKLSRRSHQNVTRWPHLLLESDTAPTDQWLRALVRLPLPIVAIYTSGGKSVHALIRCDAESKEELDSAIAALKPIVGPLGADLKALTAVRLSRLPGALRCGTEDPSGIFQAYNEPRLQRLLWLSDGETDYKAITEQLRPF